MSNLYVLSGPEKGRSFALKGEAVYVGRSPQNDVQITEKHVSRRHLKITRKRKDFFVEDLESVSGTLVGGMAIEAGKAVKVDEGVLICIGNVFLSIGKEYPGDDADPASTVDPSIGLDERPIIERPVTANKYFEFLYKLSNILMHSSDLNETLGSILEYIFDVLRRVNRGAVILVDSETGKIESTISRARDGVDVSSPTYSRAVVSKVIQQGKAVVISDTQDVDPNSRSDSMELMRIRSLMCVPLISRNKLRGVIYVDSIDKPCAFRKDDLALLVAFSSPAAVAIENAMLWAGMENLVDDRSRSAIEAKRELHKSQERFKAIFNNMSSGVIVYSVVNDGEDFVVIDLNRAALQIEKIKQKAVLGKKLSSIFPWIEGTGLLEAFRNTFRKNRNERLTIAIRNQDGSAGWRRYNLYNLPSGEIVSIFDDITESKRAEEEQKVLQRQLLVSQKMESIGGFAGGTAHNFRNILQAISGNIEYFEKIYGDNPEVKQIAESIYDSVEKGVELINNLLHYSKRGGDYHMEVLDLSDVIMSTYEIIQRVFDRRIEIRLDLKENMFVMANQSLLSQVFMNLFTNARDAMPNGGVLGIEARKVGSKVVTTVSDTGCGMDDETKERIFDPFFTLKDVGKGTGLGLSTSLGIVEQHKGSIAVFSKPGKGSTFKVYLPYSKKGVCEEEVPGKEIEQGKGQKVLIVDDEQGALAGLVSLVKALGYQPIPCANPLEVIEKYSEWAPHVVLMDRSMPELNGSSCIRKIVDKDPEARIVVISGYDDSGPSRIEEDVRTRIKDYITKPCSLAELGEILSRVLKG